MVSDSPQPDLLAFQEVIACVDLVDRAGATNFEIGYTGDENNPRWWAQVQYRGARLVCEDKATPQEAALELARRILNGGHCRCGRRSTTTYRKGRCLWRLVGPRWQPGCDVPPAKIDGARGDLAALHRAIEERRG